MTPERLSQIKELFLAALAYEPAQRAAFLAEACADDDELRAEVEALLSEASQADSFLETPAVEIEARRRAHAGTQTMEGQLIGDYRLLSLLGRGGMGEVYLARDVRLGREVALKFLPQHLLGDAERVRRFKQEALLASALNHPNIVTIYEVDRATPPRFIVTEYVEGETLRQRLQRGPLGLREALDVAVQMAAALKAAHAKGIIHRDIKPENVMLSRDGFVKVLDFSIAKLLHVAEPAPAAESSLSEVSTTRSGWLGTPAYMSPEQARREPLDARTDVFSFGVVLYEMLRGQPPFVGKDIGEVVNAILTNEPAPLSQAAGALPTELEKLIAKALHKEKTGRYQTVTALQAELQTLRDRVETAAKLREQAQLQLQADALAANPLLSEFEGYPRLQRLLRVRPQGVAPALLALGGGLLAVLLSKFVGAACVRVALETDCGVQLPPVLFGYVVELNAGVLYLVGVPLMMMAGFRLLTLAHQALRLLVAGERLIVADWQGADELPSPFAVIAERNRRFFRRWIPRYAVFALVMAYGFEYSAWDRMAFGWVQAWKAGDLRGLDLRELQQQKIFSPLPETADLLARGCTVRVGEIRGGHNRAERQHWLAPHLFFVAVALGLQAAFIVFALWLTSKVLFLFAVLIKALLGKPGASLRLELDFADTERRFGLSAMDVIYNSLLMLVLFDALILLLQQLANVPKGTSFYHGPAGWTLIGQIALLLSPLLILTAILLVPALVLLALTETFVAGHLEQLEREKTGLRKELSVAPSAVQQRQLRERLETLQQRLELARQQRPWPRRNWIYRRMLWASTAVVLLIPFGVIYIRFLMGGTLLLKMVRLISQGLCVLCGEG